MTTVTKLEQTQVEKANASGKRPVLNPWTEDKVDTKNPKRPVLIISGEHDHTVPWSVANASFKREKRNAGMTEIVKIPGSGHALTIDGGWREVADTAIGVHQEARLSPSLTSAGR